ncbi:polysaccharide deacetylase family protein [Sessilibacter sp. MAH1]
MKTFFKNRALALFNTLTLLAALSSTKSFAAVVIQYHHVSEQTPKITSITPKLFSEQIELLIKDNFEFLNAAQFASLNKQHDLDHTQTKQILVTFDDGYESVLSNAAQILNTHNIPFVVFINPSLLGKNGYLSLSQLRDLQNQGAIIANHTMTHPHLIRTLDGENQQQWQKRVTKEITEAQEFIEKNFDKTAPFFAYPYGEFNSALKKILKEKGLIGFSQHSGAVGSDSDWQALPRFAFGGDYGQIDTFADKVNSLPLPLESISIYGETGAHLLDPLLPHTSSTPIVKLKSSHSIQLSCYASGQGKINVTKQSDQSLVVQANSPLPIGRSRYNCTAPSDITGRYYWVSFPFYRKNENGSWYLEY